MKTRAEKKKREKLDTVERERERERERNSLYNMEFIHSIKNFYRKGRKNLTSGISYTVSGITLVALVVTVIILLILAGITITYVLGDRGIVQITKDARSQTNQAVENEQRDIGDLSDWLKQEKEEAENNGKTPIENDKSYVGYYADMDGNGSVDGIIYADLAVGGEGLFNNDERGIYQYSAVSEGLKKYYVSKTGYAGAFGTKDVLSPIGTGTDRFYAMALEDIKDEAHENLFCWYAAAYDKTPEKHVAEKENDFGTGKEKTNYVMAKWDAEAWGTKNADANYNDLWGAIKEEVAKGWFLPSKSEWSAFGDMISTKCGFSSYEDCWTAGLMEEYWSSSQFDSTKENLAQTEEFPEDEKSFAKIDNTITRIAGLNNWYRVATAGTVRGAWSANFKDWCLYGTHISFEASVRLSATF